ncbi:hypothetical protein NMG29_30375 [Streptomyces cocklensis]|uniref:hypothetical protein n=1 Tax=Actinacidiphila cocklensis TaxID=887465 RepID=UPI00203B11B6|nr:hypothetical protein [Actinacidiphila cocklensis]MDD1062472.1 hypothetical protein [Actinacidiphila cocklensis]
MIAGSRKAAAHPVAGAVVRLLVEPGPQDVQKHDVQQGRHDRFGSVVGVRDLVTEQVDGSK